MVDDTTLKQLKERIEGAKKTSTPPLPKEKVTPQRSAGKFLTVGSDLIAGVLVGLGMGLLSDWMFDISPWGLIVFFILGSIAGFLNVYRTLTGAKKGLLPDE